MNVLFVTDGMFPDVMSSSGRVVLETAKCFANSGHHVCVVTRRVTPDAPETDEFAGLRVRRYTAGDDVDEATQAVSAAIEAATKGVVTEVVVACQALPALAAFRCPALRGVPKVREFHAPWDEEFRIRGAISPETAPSGMALRRALRTRRRADRHTLKHAELVRVLSNRMAEKAKSIYRGCAGHTVLLPAGVDMDSFWPEVSRKEIREYFDLPADKAVLFTKRELLPGMGLEVLVDAMKEVRLLKQDFVHLIGGEGPLRDALQARIDDCGLHDHVQLLGEIPPDRLASYYQASDLVVSPPQTLEDVGLDALEALACGIPVLAAPNGSSVAVLGRFGDAFLFDGIDAQAMKKKILGALGSPERLAEMGMKGYNLVVKEYSWEKGATAFAKALRDVAMRAG